MKPSKTRDEARAEPIEALATVSLRQRLLLAFIGFGAAVLIGLAVLKALDSSRQSGELPSLPPQSTQTLAPQQMPGTPGIQSPHGIPEASVAQLLSAHSDDWRVARLQGNAAVLVIEFPSLLAQGLAFNRAAALLEKKHGARQRVLNDTQLTALVAGSNDNTETFYQGHDYTGASLAQFFNLARQQNIALNSQELRLRQLLLNAAVLAEQGGIFSARGRQAVISFSGVQLDNPSTAPDEGVDARRRESALLHELSHGAFFTQMDYQKQCWLFWQQGLTQAERQLFRRYLAAQDYDVSNEELMVNETQALLMHTPDERAFGPSSLGVSAAQFADFKTRFNPRAQPPAPLP